jgi:hypothetical protein
MVVNAITLAPIPRALVSTPDSRYAALSDSSGRFELDLSPENANSTATPGGPTPLTSSDQLRIWVNARKPGFLAVGEQGALASPGKDVALALTPEALIIGRVTFSTPDTTTHVNVQLFTKQVQDGLPRWLMQHSTMTNSAGEFRFADLSPGEYRLGTKESMDNDPGPMISRTQVYGFPPLYFAGAADFASATNIELSAGQTVQADIPLVRQPYYSVKIPVNGYSGSGLNIQVSSQGRRGPGYSLGFNASENKIEGMLPNGNYVVTATGYGENSVSGTTSIRVAGPGVDGPALTMAPNNRIALNVREEFTPANAGPSGRLNNLRSSDVRGPRPHLQVNFEPADDFGQGVPATLRPPTGSNDDSMVLENLPPGRYWLRLIPLRGYVASATMGTIDLLHQPLVVSAGSAATIEVMLRDDFSSVEGIVTGWNTENATEQSNFQNAWIYLVPLPDGPGQFQQFGSPPNETFTFGNIVPGNYRAMAFSQAHQNLPYRDPEAMKTYESKGQVIHLVAGQKTSVQLQIIPEE